MTRAILVNEEKNYVAYAREKNEGKSFETDPHAVIQVLVKAKGSEAEGGTLYLLKYPCYDCAKALVYAGIRKIVFKNNDLGDPTYSEAHAFLESTNVEVIQNKDIDF